MKTNEYWSIFNYLNEVHPSESLVQSHQKNNIIASVLK